jgi:hypothetical protein
MLMLMDACAGATFLVLLATTGAPLFTWLIVLAVLAFPATGDRRMEESGIAWIA